MLDSKTQKLIQLSNTDLIPADSIIICDYITKVSTLSTNSSCQCSLFDCDTSNSAVISSAQSFIEVEMNKNRAVTDQSTNSMPSVTRQNSPQHKMCLPRNKVLQNAKTVNPQQQMQIPIYLNETQLALLNSKYSPRDASRQYTTDQGKVTITTAKSGTNSSTIPSTVYQQQQQLMAQHLHHQTHNYLQQVVINNPDSAQNAEHPNANSTGTGVSYLIAPNLVVSHNQLSQLSPRDLAVLQQKLFHQQHLYQHQQQQQQQQQQLMQASSSSNQHLTCTCPSELHRAMHVQQQQQQQQQRLLEQRKLLAAQLSAMHGGPQIKLTPVTANTLPRDLHSHHLHQSKLDATSPGLMTSQGHLCQNHQLSLQRQIDLVDNVAPVIPATETTDTIVKEAHTCSLNNSGDSGYNSNREQSTSEVDAQISNLITWIESVYGIKLVDYISKNYSLQTQSNIQNCCGHSREINGNEFVSCTDSPRIKTFISEMRSELDHVQILVKTQYEFFKDSLNQISCYIQSQGSHHINERIKLFEYNQAVLAHKIQTVHTTLSSYISSEEKYQLEVINNISRNVSDINEDYSKLQENYILIEKPVKFNIENSNQHIDRHQSILSMVSKAMISSQSQLNTLNYTMTDLIKKQSSIKPPRKTVTLPEEAMESVVALREELHRAILAMTPDLDKRQAAYEILERFLQEKTQVPEFVEAQGNFEDILDANLSGIDDMTPTLEESPDFGTTAEISSSVLDEDDSLPPPPPIDSVDSPVPINMTDHLSHIDMTAESIPMIDETPSSESFDDACFNEPTIILVKSNTLKKRGNVEDDLAIDSKPSQKIGTILKTSSGIKTSKTNKVVFCNTVTVEDGTETIRLNCPSEESDLEEKQNEEDSGTIRKTPPPPPPRRTSQITGADNTEGDINYENLESFTSDMRHHILHHNIVCVPMGVKGTINLQATANHSTDKDDKRRTDVGNIKLVKGKALCSPSENDVWQRQTEFNTLSSRHGQTGPPGPTAKVGPKATDQKIKTDKSNKKK